MSDHAISTLLDEDRRFPPDPAFAAQANAKPEIYDRDPDEFWHAWAAGGATTVDTFAPDWDFWAYVDVPIRALRTRWSIPAEGLDAQA